jgi:hypothetical protein
MRRYFISTCGRQNAAQGRARRGRSEPFAASMYATSMSRVERGPRHSAAGRNHRSLSWAYRSDTQKLAPLPLAIKTLFMKRVARSGKKSQTERRSVNDRRDVAGERRSFPRPEGRRMNAGRRVTDPQD